MGTNIFALGDGDQGRLRKDHGKLSWMKKKRNLRRKERHDQRTQGINVSEFFMRWKAA